MSELFQYGDEIDMNRLLKDKQYYSIVKAVLQQALPQINFDDNFGETLLQDPDIQKAINNPHDKSI